MSPAFAIARFEIRQRLRRISTWVYFALFFALAVLFILAAGGALKGATIDFGTGGKVFVNSPYSLHFLETLIAVFGTVIVASIAGQATFQDIEHNATALFYTTPIKERQYLFGRLAGALLVCVLIYIAIALGAAFATHLPMLDASRRGPGPGAGAYLTPYLTVLLPNLFITVALFFSLAALTRRMLPVYAGSVVLMIGYLIALNLSDDVENKTLTSLLDPFGLIATDRITEYWTVIERNTRRVPLEGVLLGNRLLWVGFAGALLVFAFTRFSFIHAVSTGKGARRNRFADVAPPLTVPGPPIEVPAVALDFSPRASLGLLWKLTRLQWRETVKSIIFLIIVLAGVLFMVSTTQSVGRLLGTTTWPVTYQVLELVGGSFQIFILAIIAFYSGELVWRERDARLAQIHDALPTPRWVVFASKWLALVGVQVVLLALVLASGVVLQTLKGYHHYELGLYVRWLFAMRLFDLSCLCTLAMLMHVVINQKYAGHFAMVGYYIVTITLPLLGFEHKLYRFNSQPDWQYSDLNGFGHFIAPIIWFKVYWGCLALVMAVAANLLWVRGVETGWKARLHLARERLSRPVLTALAIGLAAFAGTGAFLFYHFDVRNTYRTKFEREELSARYEKRYKPEYGSLAPPRIQKASVQVDIFPSERRVVLRGDFLVENRCGQPIDRMLINLPEKARIDKLTFNREESLLVDDRPAQARVIRLAQPLKPGENTALSFALVYEPKGLEQGSGDLHVVHNGTFFNSQEYLPVLGYSEASELADDDTRKKHGLAEKPRMRDLDDPKGLENTYVSKDADWISFDATLSTSLDQLAIAPGYLQKEWTENGRRYFHYTMDAKILNFYSFISARYAVKRDAWNGVAIEVYYHPSHDYDIDRMIRGVKASLDYFTREFGPYQHRQVRIIEFPRYERFAQSFPNTIPYSESIGFIARVDDSKQDEIDYPFYVTAHEVAHQWWAHQVIGAEVQGSTMLSESFSQYSAFMVMKHAYGERAMRKFLRYELDMYLRGRSTERKRELPLMRVENQDYIHYAKGALAMYALQDALGEASVNRVLRAYLEQTKYKGPPYTTTREFMAVLRREAPPGLAPLIHDLFEEITLYELRATAATAKKRADGRYEVTVKASAKKLRAGELGAEVELPIDEEIVFGALDEKGTALRLEKRRVKGRNVEATLVVEGKPTKAGIDPLNMLIDRKPEDNVVAVEVQ